MLINPWSIIDHGLYSLATFFNHVYIIIVTLGNCIPRILFSKSRWPLRRYRGRIFDRLKESGKILLIESGIRNPTNGWNSESKFYGQILESSRISISNNDFKFRPHVSRYLYRIQKFPLWTADSKSCGFTRYVWTEAESAKKNLRIQKLYGYVWMGPKFYLQCLNAHRHLEFYGVFSSLPVNN